MCNWCREVGKRNGFVVIIKKLDSGSNVKKPRIVFLAKGVMLAKVNTSRKRDQRLGPVALKNMDVLLP